MFKRIPGVDEDFHRWQAEFVAYLEQNRQELGIQPSDWSLVMNAQTEWMQVFEDHRAAQTAAREIAEAKEDARQILETLLRSLGKHLQDSNKSETAA